VQAGVVSGFGDTDEEEALAPPRRERCSEVVRMETDFVIVDGVVVPESALRRAEERNVYGSLPDLDDEELADPDELERQVYLQEFGPLLALPVKGKGNGFRLEFVDSGGLEFSAFATVDFDRTRPRFDKARYKLDRLRDRLKDVLIMFSVILERMPKQAATVLRLLKQGVIGREHLATEDIQALADLQAKADGVRAEIQEVRESLQRRREREAARILARLE